MINTSAWFALYTRHQHEKAVARILSQKGFGAFLPLYQAAHRWKDRVKQMSLPLFPNYIFVFAGSGQFAPILQTPGVFDFVRLGSFPAPVPAKEIEAVQQIVERGLIVEPHPFLKCGDRARILSGPLKGLEGILVRKKNFCRLVLSVDLLLKSVSVEVEAADVERVTGGHGARTFPAGAANLHPCE